MDCEGREKSGEKEMEDGIQLKQLARKGNSILCLSWIAQD